MTLLTVNEEFAMFKFEHYYSSSPAYTSDSDALFLENVSDSSNYSFLSTEVRFRLRGSRSATG